MGKLFRARAVVTSNESYEVFSDDAFLAVEKNKIVDVGPWHKRPKAKTFSLVDARYGMIIPGLFNLHTHLPMTLFRGIAEDLDLQSWLFKNILPLEQKWMSPEFVRVGAELGVVEEALAKVLTDGGMDPSDSNNPVIAGRSHKWISRIQQIHSQPGIHFFAVGTAHLLGDHSVLELLRKRGFRVRRIESEQDLDPHF